MIAKLMRYARTAHHLKNWQIAGRMVAPIKRRVGFPRIPTPPEDLTGRLEPHAPFRYHSPWNSRSELLAGTFSFLGRSERLGWAPVDWAASHLPLLWTFNLHYFNYLHLLRKAEQETICRDWVHAHPPRTAVAWHPYPTSLRIVNWCKAGVDDPVVLRSLYEQAAYLYRNLETYVYGNHLLENARALVVAGRFFHHQGEADRWHQRGMSIYRDQTPEQILSDGAHYERSPMYQALMLEGWLDVINVLSADDPSRPQLMATARSMADFLVSMTHPDGDLALFNDSTQEIAASTETIVRYARDVLDYEPVRRARFPEAGYFIHDGGDIYLVIDGGPVGPEHLMAHAHADIFSFSLSLKGMQMIVDSGVFEYAAGAMRSYVRSTAAHNTVTVDGLDQVECWGSFRVARRSEPYGVSFQHSDTESRFDGSFDGFSTFLPDRVTHHRHISVDNRTRTIMVADSVQGDGTHLVESRSHFHPDVQLERNGSNVTVRRGSITLELHVLKGELSLEHGWYCPRFGEKRRNRVIVVAARSALPVMLEYVVHF